MSKNLTLCNNCAGKIVLSLKRHVMRAGVKGDIPLAFCCEECADTFYAEDNSYPSGLAWDLGLEEGGW